MVMNTALRIEIAIKVMNMTDTAILLVDRPRGKSLDQLRHDI